MLVQAVFYNLGSIPDWVTAISALVAISGVIIGYFDYIERTRPYIDIEIEPIPNKEPDIWNFFAKVINKGQFPVYSQITKSLLIIGDEKYPTVFDQNFVIFPGDEKKLIAPVGNINAHGRKKIREAKYTRNIVELQLEVSSRKIREKNYKYKTLLRVQILVEEENPGLIFLEKSFT